MKVTLQFHGKSEASVLLTAETEAEKAILAFLTEGYARRWQCSHRYTYRPSGVDRVELVEVPEVKQ